LDEVCWSAYVVGFVEGVGDDESLDLAENLQFMANEYEILCIEVDGQELWALVGQVHVDRLAAVVHLHTVELQELQHQLPKRGGGSGVEL
jgi:hypothetical protein